VEDLSLSNTLLKDIYDRVREFELSLKSFVNRESELNELINTYLPIIMIYGKFGQGKTKLAKMLVNKLRDRGEEVIYVALRLADQYYRGEFLTLHDIFKTYYSKIGVVPKDRALRFLGPLIIDHIGFKETYKNLEPEALNVHTRRSSVSGNDLKEIYGSDRPDTLVKGALKHIKTRLTIIIDEFEDLINNFVRLEGEVVTRSFIDNILSIARYMYDLSPGIFRLILLIIPRTAIDLRSIITGGSIAWTGVTREITLGKLSEDDLMEYANKLMCHLLKRDVRLGDIFEKKSIELLKVALKGLPVTRFATDLIKQVIADVVTYMAQLVNATTYEDLLKNSSTVLEKLKEKKLYYNVEAYLKLSKPSHDEIVKNYRKILEYIKNILTNIHRKMVVGPIAITLQRGYESYYLEITKLSGRGKERLRFIFWLRPSAIKPKDLVVDKIIKNLDLETARKMGVKTFVYVVSFEESKYLGQYVDLLNSLKDYVVMADSWVPAEVLKFALSDRLPPKFIEQTLRDFIDEEVRRLAEDILLKSELLS